MLSPARIEVDHQCRRGDGGDRITHLRSGAGLTRLPGTAMSLNSSMHRAVEMAVCRPSPPGSGPGV